MAGVQDRVALVTGGGAGDRRRRSRARLAADGAKVGVLDLKQDAAQAVADEITAAGGTAIGLGADVSKRDQVQAAVDQLVGEFGGLHILVNNAGVLRDNLLFKMTDDDWTLVMEVHLRGAFLCSQIAQKHMVEAKYGRIVSHVLDVGAGQPRPGQLLDRQGRPAGPDQDAGDRARPVRRHRQRDRARLHRDGDDQGDRRAHRHDDRADARGRRVGGPGAPRRRARTTSPTPSRSSPARSPATSPARSSTSTAAAACSERAVPAVRAASLRRAPPRSARDRAAPRRSASARRRHHAVRARVRSRDGRRPQAAGPAVA